MILKKVCAVILLISFVFTIGCSSIQTATSLNGLKLTTAEQSNVEHLNAKNSGLYVLWIPLLTGSTEHPGMIAVMEDTVSLDSTVDMLSKKAKEDGATAVIDMGSSRSSVWIIPLLVFFWRNVAVSANGVK